MQHPRDPSAPALRLASASRTGMALKELPLDERPATLEQAYAIQAAFLLQLGEGTAGWKLAGASPRGLRGELPNAPSTGLLVPSRVMPSHAAVALPHGRTATLEVEIAFCFSRDVAPSEETFDAASMISHASLAVEVVCSRFLDRKSVGQPSFLADNIGFHALVCGDFVDFAVPAFSEAEAGLWRDDERIASGLTGSDRTDPFQSLAFLWNKLRSEGGSIAKGAIVTTGTLTAPVDVTKAGNFEARLGNYRTSFSLTQ